MGHGYRLDAADKQWHLTSPTPYDPPLTYSGWQAAKSLGVRIGAIIRERVLEDEAAAKQAPDPSLRRKRKRYKVVLHSSPFLRCIQTSIAISAGLAQDSTPFGPASDSRPPSPPATQNPPLTRPTVVTDVRDIGRPTGAVPIRRSVLRLDAFLGEWLSPGYFELITPPPESVMMLASAKADLLRREDYTSNPNFSAHFHSNSQGHLWSPGSLPTSGSTDSPESATSLSGSLSRSASLSSQGGQRISSSLPTGASGYMSPVPHYAVSSNHTIPPGYVAHARDFCVDIDYQWDSMRSPLNWGDGGTFPEEWTSMHRRFRAGVQHLVDWYSTVDNPTDMVTKTAMRRRKDSDECAIDDADEVETEAVVVLVSHGAGCNALIGAITHQPVLMDVAMASLTMADRKPGFGPFEDGKAARGAERPVTSSVEGVKETVLIHQYYDLKMFANTDHIRSPSSTPHSSRSPSVVSILSGTRGRYSNSFSSSLSNFPLNENSVSRSSSANAALSSLRRGSNTSSRPAFGVSSGNGNGSGITVGSGVTSFKIKPPSFSSRKPPVGLWSPVSADTPDDEDEDDDDILLNFSHEQDAHASTAASSMPVTNRSTAGTPPSVPRDLEFGPRAVTNNDAAEDLGSPSALSDSPQRFPELGGGHGGLWGAGPSLVDEVERRDFASTKRRWTITERS
ncbi:hypothetical protein B0T24DRAFT_674984 [Lasiosphaeria ovina]|uniref:Phosphoglycerate mutase family protein n=1 Tax=Lasiosphaeria ovina TaxID=92902 RepID=A0AAE0KMV7_9PEZI|nr:hypothetical protein B0T24DRAFT_674984 [Lasiosphaeria ovina]